MPNPRLLPLPMCAVAWLFAALLLACGSGNKAQNQNANAARPAGAPASASAVASAASAAAGSATTAAAAVVSGPSAQTTPVPGAATDANGCLQFQLLALSDADGTPVVLPATDPNKWTVPDSFVPAGFINLGKGADPKAENTSANSLAIGTADPQASFTHLNQIGMLGGRHQEWYGPKVASLTPIIDQLHLVFSSVPGARNFLRNPVVSAAACVKEISGPQIGQESRHFTYTAPVKSDNGGSLVESGFGVMWRCGRVVLNSVEVGAPGEFTQQSAETLAQNVQTQFLKTDPC